MAGNGGDEGILVERPLTDEERRKLKRFDLPFRLGGLFLSYGAMGLGTVAITGNDSFILGEYAYFYGILYTLALLGLVLGIAGFQMRGVKRTALAAGTVREATGELIVKEKSPGRQQVIVEVKVGPLSFETAKSEASRLGSSGRVTVALVGGYPDSPSIAGRNGMILSANGSVLPQPLAVKVIDARTETGTAVTKVDPQPPGTAASSAPPPSAATTEPGPPCPECKRPLTWQATYSKWYCTSCVKYPWG